MIRNLLTLELVLFLGFTAGFTALSSRQASLKNAFGRSTSAFSLYYSNDDKKAASNSSVIPNSFNDEEATESTDKTMPFFADQKSKSSDSNAPFFSSPEDMGIDWDSSSKSSKNDEDASMKVVFSEKSLRKWLKDENLAAAPDVPFDVVWERTWDTMEDVLVHLRRWNFEHDRVKLTPEEDEKRKTVVVLGSGWASHALMKVADCRKVRLIVISPTNHFVFTPMLASSSVGTVEYRSMTDPVRSANPMIDDYYEGKAIGVDVEKKVVTVKLNSLLEDVRNGDPPTIDVPYDHLVCSVGCRVNDRGVPGAEKALRLKTLDDARNLRRDVAECFEYASRPDVAGPEHTEERTRRATFLIVGGGPTGVELGGEIIDLANDITRKYGPYPKLKDNIRVVVAHGGPDLVPQFEPNLRKEALKSLEKKGAEVYLNTRVTEVGDGFAKLSTKILDEETGEVVRREEFTMPLGLTVWCAGVAPVSFTETLLQQLPESARNRNGRINVDKWLRPPMPRPDLDGSVLVLGDAAACPSATDSNEVLPQTAQVAGQQGAFVARMLNRDYDLGTTPPVALPTNITGDGAMRFWLQWRHIEDAPTFSFLNLGILAYLGGGEGA
eukprot:scaffold3170_cov128-Cylindrotheca_fusiformis.AAC.14